MYTMYKMHRYKNGAAVALQCNTSVVRMAITGELNQILSPWPPELDTGNHDMTTDRTCWETMYSYVHNGCKPT